MELEIQTFNYIKQLTKRIECPENERSQLEKKSGTGRASHLH